jgi:conjugal transfer pilus assembly protein TraA
MDYLKSDAMKKWAVIALVLGVCMMGAEAVAGTADTDFSVIATKLNDWATGTLGRVIALSIFIVGIAMGIVQQSVVAAVVAVGGALILNYGPPIIMGLISATV